MTIKNYTLFLETLSKKTIPYYYSNRFRDVLLKLSNAGNVISQMLLDSENSNQVSDDITLIDLTDKEDMVSFIQLNRMERFREGEEKEIDILDYVKSVWTNHVRNSETELEHRGWKEQRTEIGIGRFVNRVFQKAKITPNPSDVEKFVNSYKTRIKMINNVDSLFELVSGEDIKKWYLESSYQSKMGQLSKSCMRYGSCQSYFDIYTKNPEVCQLLILKGSEKDKIVGRALVWKLKNGKTYMDRQYCNDDSDMSLYKEFAKKNGWLYYGDSNLQTLQVKLKPISINQFPYMDTFLCYNHNDYLLSDNENLWPDTGWWKLRSTSGGFDGDDVVYSAFNGEYISADGAVYCEDVDDWRTTDQAVYLDSRDTWYSEGSDEVCWNSYREEYLHTDDAVYSEFLQTWLESDDSIMCSVSSDEEVSVPKDMENQVTLEVFISGGERVCLLDAIMKNPFTNEWVFKKDKILVYPCPKLGTEITKEYAESNNLEIDTSKGRFICLSEYISSQIGDVNPELLLDYLVELEPNDKIFEKINSYKGEWSLSGNTFKDIEKFNILKCAIWFSYKDSEKSDYFIVQNKNKGSSRFIRENESVFLKFMDRDTYSKLSEVAFWWTALLESVDFLIWDIIEDPEMKKIYYAIKYK